MLDGCELEEPVRIENGAVIRNSRIGPNVTVGADARIENSDLRDTIIGEGTRIEGSKLTSSFIGEKAILSKVNGVVSVGGYSEIAGEA
jgi:glucose-1-phosphate thymidylyltransferase